MKEKKFNLREAKEACFRLLKFRLRSEKELADKLKLKGFPGEVINQAIERLKEIGLVDDRQFTRAVIASRLKRPLGKTRIRLELIKKGVDKELIDEELARLVDKDSEIEIVRELAIKRAKKYKDIDRAKLKQRLFGYLTRRGFNSYTTMKVINEL